MATKRPRHGRPRRTYELALTGELEGYHVTLSAMSGREVVSITTAKMSQVEALDLLDAHTVTHDFDVERLSDLDHPDVVAIMQAWRRAMDEAALPQASGES